MTSNTTTNTTKELDLITEFDREFFNNKKEEFKKKFNISSSSAFDSSIEDIHSHAEELMTSDNPDLGPSLQMFQMFFNEILTGVLLSYEKIEDMKQSSIDFLKDLAESNDSINSTDAIDQFAENIDYVAEGVDKSILNAIEHCHADNLINLFNNSSNTEKEVENLMSIMGGYSDYIPPLVLINDGDDFNVTPLSLKNEKLEEFADGFSNNLTFLLVLNLFNNEDYRYKLIENIKDDIIFTNIRKKILPDLEILVKSFHNTHYNSYYEENRTTEYFNDLLLYTVHNLGLLIQEYCNYSNSITDLTMPENIVLH